MEQRWRKYDKTLRIDNQPEVTEADLNEGVASWVREFVAEALAETAVLRMNGANDLASARDRVLQQLVEEANRWSDAELTVREAAAEAGVSEETVRRYVRSGRIPDLRERQGQQHRVRRRDLAPLAPVKSGIYDPITDAQDTARLAWRES